MEKEAVRGEMARALGGAILGLSVLVALYMWLGPEGLDLVLSLTIYLLIPVLLASLAIGLISSAGVRLIWNKRLGSMVRERLDANKSMQPLPA